MKRPDAGEGPSRPRILLVDDYDDTRELFATVLETSGFEVIQADCGEKALELATELLPDLVITDLSLPDIDGCALTRSIKKCDRTSRIPVVALSAHGSYSKMREAIEAGCVTFVPKSRSPRYLAEEIRRLMG
ncbi:MAG: response regulator [Myxococcota bacterium]